MASRQIDHVSTSYGALGHTSVSSAPAKGACMSASQGSSSTTAIIYDLEVVGQEANKKVYNCC
jgi:hypothetical protein